MTALALLGSTFLVVFALGLQSQLVNNGHYVSAFLNSLVIGSSQLVLFKLAPDATGIEIAAYLAGGPFGIVASMVAYRRLKRRRTTTDADLPRGQVPKPHPWPAPPNRIARLSDSGYQPLGSADPSQPPPRKP